jgi:hypothetical protein
MESPFDILGVKINLLAMDGMYADLMGGVLDTTRFIPWNDVVTQIVRTGANNVIVNVSAGVLRHYTDNGFDPDLSYNPPMEAVRGLVSLLQANGLDVTISAFVHVADAITGDSSAEGGGRAAPTDPALWQKNYGVSLVNWANFAQEVGATAFIPFQDETQHMLRMPSLTQGWLDLIAQIRSVYSGPLTTTWYTDGSGQPITTIPSAIIEQLDYIGIGLFPDLTDDPDATLEELQAALLNDRGGNNSVQMMEDLASLYGKQVWISDKALHSFDGAAADSDRIFNASIPLGPGPAGAGAALRVVPAGHDGEQQRLARGHLVSELQQPARRFRAGPSLLRWSAVRVAAGEARRSGSQLMVPRRATGSGHRAYRQGARRQTSGRRWSWHPGASTSH